jgi:CheY-like chemotaxis protein
MPHRPAGSTVEKSVEDRKKGPADAFVIDDDPLMGELLERHLGRRGVTAKRFEESARLLDELTIHPPRLLFTDLEMPRVSGADLVTAVRERGFRGTIVLVTASRERAAVHKAIANGADEVLGKPVKEFELDCLLEKARLREKRREIEFDSLREVLEPVSQGIVLMDESLRPVLANKRAREILEAASPEEIGTAVERSGIAGEMRKIGDKRGTVAFVDLSKRRGERGNPIGIETHRLSLGPSKEAHLVLMHDFSEWRKLDEIHSRFATYLSHRMRTPLTSIRNAVKILSEGDEALGAAEKERFLDIGCRNVEKLIGSFDEIQKIFMVESGEINACRSFVKIGRELHSILGECEREKSVAGFKVHAPEYAVRVSRSRLKSYCRGAAEAMTRWLGAAPYLECIVSVQDGVSESGEDDPSISVSLAPRGRTGEMALADFLESQAVDQGLILETLARAMDGASIVSPRGALRLQIPAEPSYDRNKDLIHPLHVMLERAELGALEFHLVSVRIAGGAEEARRFAQVLAGSLPSLFRKEDAIASRCEEPSGFHMFVVGAGRARIDEAMESLRERHAQSCRERGEELFPSIHWEIVYHCEPGSSPDRDACSLVESLV